MIFHRNKGFTLVELLVVMAIITVLLGVLLPSISRSRQQAQFILCLNNLRQMSIAAVNYTLANNAYYPLAYYTQKVGKVRYYYTWDFTTYKDWSVTPPKEIIEPGILWQKVTIEKVQQCPSFKGSANWLTDTYTGYNYNTSYIGMDETVWPYNSVRTAKVKRPSETVIFGDGQWENGANKFMRAPWKSKGDTFQNRIAGTQGYRHLGKTNAAFCDGHVQSLKDRFTNTDDTCGKQSFDEYNKTHSEKIGFLSPDNSLYDLE